MNNCQAKYPEYILSDRLEKLHPVFILYPSSIDPVW